MMIKEMSRGGVLYYDMGSYLVTIGSVYDLRQIKHLNGKSSSSLLISYLLKSEEEITYILVKLWCMSGIISPLSR